jgi:hypothetical protein
LLQLVMECREWSDPEAKTWAARLEPLESLAVDRFATWLPKLTHPVRSGEHSQTAFALGLLFDWASSVGNPAILQLVRERALAFYAGDRDAPLRYEPSGHDFLSPALAEADVLRRVMPTHDFADWLDGFLPSLKETGSLGWLIPVTVSDPSDGKLAHLDGLNLSRAWMLQGIAHALPAEDPRHEALSIMANEHTRAGLASVTGEHYAGGHWLGSFAAYLITRRGLETI